MPTLKISVPKTPKSSYNPARPVSQLLKSQIRLLQTAVYEAIDSEGEAADCIETLTKLLQRVRPQVVPERHGAKKTARKRKATPAAKGRRRR